MCVNALNGLLLFLRHKLDTLAYYRILCQRPKRASSISTLLNMAHFANAKFGVNALNGLLLFLR